jgi:MoxR-like ATPase
VSQLFTWDEIPNLVSVIARTGQRVCFWGRPGTGKTHAASVEGPGSEDSLSITFGDESPGVAEIRGHYVVKDGAMVWEDGPAITAWKQGKRLVINELDHAGSDVMSFLHVLLDDPSIARMTLPNGETVTPQPGFHVVATMNGEPTDLSDPLRDRLLFVEISEPNPGAIAALDADLRDAAVAGVMASDPERALSLRPWFNFQTLRRDLGVDAAGRVVFAERWPDVSVALTLSDA